MALETFGTLPGGEHPRRGVTATCKPSSAPARKPGERMHRLQILDQGPLVHASVERLVIEVGQADDLQGMAAGARTKAVEGSKLAFQDHSLGKRPVRLVRVC
jgi:hypothetical protein